MKKMQFGILLVVAVLALVSVASAALPSSVNANIIVPGPASYFDVDITSGGNTDLTNGNYAGWCADHDINGITKGHIFTLYDPRISLPAGIKPIQWNKVNYILNNPSGNWKITQAAIWHYGATPGFPSDSYTSGYNHAAFTAYINSVEANIGSFVPSLPGEKYAVILWDPKKVQPVFITATIWKHHESPEFPTLALPVAMMVGFIGLVLFIRTRKE